MKIECWLRKTAIMSDFDRSLYQKITLEIFDYKNRIDFILTGQVKFRIRSDKLRN